MRPALSIALAAGMALVLGASLVFSPSASSGPFGGSEPATCGAGQDCTSSTFTADTASGTGYSCATAVSACFDPGPGANNAISTDGSGRLILGNGAGTAEVWVGETGGIQLTENSNLTIANGAIIMNATTFLVNQTATEPVKIDDTHGLRINTTTPIKGVVMLAATVDIGSISASSCLDVTATVAGVEASDKIFVTPDFDHTANSVLIGNARVTNAGTDEVTFRACNVSTLGAEDPDSGSYLFLVMR